MRSCKMSDSKEYIDIDDSIFDEIGEYFDKIVKELQKQKKE